MPDREGLERSWINPRPENSRGLELPGDFLKKV